jgi:spore germination protein YaaH
MYGDEYPANPRRELDALELYVPYYFLGFLSQFQATLSSKPAKSIGKRAKLTFQSLFRPDAFGYITPGTFEIGPMPGTDPSTFSDFTALKSRNPSLVAGISIGGWSFNDNNTNTQPVFGDIVSSPANRQTFINKLMSFMKHYGFDAVDIDWEYPGAPDRQPNQANSQANGGNYVLLLQEMRSAFNAQPYNWEISFTAPTSYWYAPIFLFPFSFSKAPPR